MCDFMGQDFGATYPDSVEREEILRAMDEAAIEYVELLDFAIVPLGQATKAWNEPTYYIARETVDMHRVPKKTGFGPSTQKAIDNAQVAHRQYQQDPVPHP